MSISLVMIPLAVAAVGAWQAANPKIDSQGRTVCQVETRMRDADLLAAALRDTQAEVTTDQSLLTAQWQGVTARFTCDTNGIWQADFTGDVDTERAVSIIGAVDAAYGLRVQQAVLARLRQRAPAAGMTVTRETIEADQSVTMVLELGTQT